MKIAIVDDEDRCLDEIERRVKEFFSAKNAPVEMSGYTSGKALLAVLAEEKRYDVYFLDVEMTELDGLELARRIRGFQKDARIVLVTSFPRYMMDGYRVHAYYFILKSDCQTEIPEVLEMIWSDAQAEEEGQTEDSYIIQNYNSAQCIQISKIVWITKEKKYIVFHCAPDGQGQTGFLEFRERKTLEQIYSRLPSECFIYVNKGCIVNMSYVYSQKRQEVVLRAGGQEYVCEISQRVGSQVKNALAEYWKKQ